MNYIKQLDTPVNPSGRTYNDLFKQYEKVVMESLFTSFGLDFLIQDQYGGDVDTIHNVREIGKDPQMTYKNEYNKTAYESMPHYNREIHDQWHKGGENFRQVKHAARVQFQATGKRILDEYTGGELGFYGHTKSISADKKAELDHINSTKAIYEDRGRVLSGLDGKELADDPSNFAWTNKSLNASMGAKSNSEYVKEHPELNDVTKKNLIEKEASAKESYDMKINRAYYTSKGFLKDTGKAAAKTCFKMGLRQALGFIFSEIWFSVRDEIRDCIDDKSLFKKIAEGIKKGLKNAMKKYKELWQKFVDGAIAGVLSSLVTTLCNMFFSTAKSLVKIIRQTWVSLVEAAKILLFNPDNLPLGEQLRAATKIIATAASIVAGTMVSELIAKTAIGTIPVVGEIVQVFIGTLVTGIMSCSLLFLMDTNPMINKAVEMLNNLSFKDNTISNLKVQAEAFEKYCAELMKIDYKTFQKEIHQYSMVTATLENCVTESQFNSALKKIYVDMNISLPWNGDFNDFMANPNNKLVFK